MNTASQDPVRVRLACPNHPPERRPPVRPALTLTAAVLALSVTACGGAASSPASTPPSAPAAVKSTPDQPPTIGTPITIGTTTITLDKVTDVTEPPTPGTCESIGYTNGCRYIAAHLTITNTGDTVLTDQASTVASGIRTHVTDQDGATNSQILADTSAGQSIRSFELRRGQSAKGWITYTLPVKASARYLTFTIGDNPDAEWTIPAK